MVKTTTNKKTKQLKSRNSSSRFSKSDEAASQVPTVDIASRELLKKLVSNDEEIREKAVKTVTQLLTTKRKLEGFQFLKLWKGLWYTMWHSDTPLIQQALARDLAQLTNEINDKNVFEFVKSFYSIAILEWGTLDRYRINKFYMLVRFVLNAQLTRLQSHNWNPAQLAEFVELMLDDAAGPLSYSNAKTSHSLRLHLIDIYTEELEKVIENGQRRPSKDQIDLILKPLLSQSELSEFKHIKKRVIEEVYSDERLVNWNIITPKEEEPESVDSDWEGFD